MNVQPPGSTTVDQAPTQSVGRYRRGIGIAALLVGAGFIIHGITAIQQGCMDALVGMAEIIIVGVPLVLLGLISLYIGSLLRSSPNRGRRAALVFDALAVIAAVIGLAVMSGQYYLNGSYQTLGATLLTYSVIWALVVIFALEAAWLLRAWRWFWVLAAACVLLAVALPVVSYNLHVRHIQPLLEYVDAHWVTVPDDTPLIVQRRPGTGRRHGDSAVFWVGRARWFTAADHVASDGWRFAGDVPAASASWRGPARISTCDQAVSQLRNTGIADETATSACAVRDKFGGEAYKVSSTKIRGHYIVKPYGDVELFLSKPVMVPERLR